jgi:hypothetical protein
LALKESSEKLRLDQDRLRLHNWKRWGTYLPERQWGTVREDYSNDGSVWSYFTHDHARSRAYRWGEDGLLGFTDRECRLCFAPTIWNGKDTILKERLFGLTGPEGNHGEDVKEVYFYLDATPTSSYCKALYKYPQLNYPYTLLVDENRARGITKTEFELIDSGIFDDRRYFDLEVEYAKAAPDDICIQLTVHNRYKEASEVFLLPTLWFRNTWSWLDPEKTVQDKPSLSYQSFDSIQGWHATLGKIQLSYSCDHLEETVFTENETNSSRIFDRPNLSPYVKDAFHSYLCLGENSAVNPALKGTKAAPIYRAFVDARGKIVVRLRLSLQEKPHESEALLGDFDETLQLRKAEADAFYEEIYRIGSDAQEKMISRQAYAGLCWSKQFYHYVVEDWINQDADGSPIQGTSRRNRRNKEWMHLFSRDVISMPDKWEYPWFAAWDLAFHVVAIAKADPDFAKQQLILFLREWYMHPNGQIPAYEFAFSDVNPPVHAWAAFRVYKMTGKRGERDRAFLESVYQKLLLNFTWWVNRKDPSGNNLFSGGFLGLDNIGIFDRGAALPTGGHLQQSDGTAWMAFYCLNMLAMSLELARDNPVYEDLASKFFEHFVTISDAMNSFGGSGLWNFDDQFYYDHLSVNEQHIPLKTRSLVGLLPIIAVVALEEEELARFPGFRKRLKWFLENRADFARNAIFGEVSSSGAKRLLAIPSKERLTAVLKRLLDEKEFLSPYGIRSVSKFHEKNPYTFHVSGHEYRVDYVPGESNTTMFGGNSNWRGPIWFPINYLLVEALERYHYFFGDHFKVECPVGSGVYMTLKEAAAEIARRLNSIFKPGAKDLRPCFGNDTRFRDDPDWQNLILFHEFFHGDSGLGLGASHQTGWTALVTRLTGN